MRTINIIPAKINGKLSIELPLSKSISNRLQIIGFLSNSENLIKIADADDSRILHDLLNNLRLENIRSDNKLIYNAGDAGTTYRFLSALFACLPGERILTGSPRMLERPIYPLISVLTKLGAKCEYLSKMGYPPVKICGGELIGGTVEIDSSISSQFISALMLIAPYIKNGLCIRLAGEPVSYPYILLTAELMIKSGVKVIYKENEVRVFEGKYDNVNDLNEADWSSASYWFAFVALCNELVEVRLKGLSKKSEQGDRIISDLFLNLGVKSVWECDDLVLIKEGTIADKLELNLKPYPDLLPALAVTTAALQVESLFTGLETLVIKESNRLVALTNELKKLGYNCYATDRMLKINIGKKQSMSKKIATYNDHRIAMAFSVLALSDGELIIENPDTVIKSYPTFWEDLKMAGIKLS